MIRVRVLLRADHPVLEIRGNGSVISTALLLISGSAEDGRGACVSAQNWALGPVVLFPSLVQTSQDIYILFG